MTNTMENIEATVAQIMKKTTHRAVREYKYLELVSVKNSEQTGVVVAFTLGSNFVFHKKLLDEWQRMLKADDYSLRLKNRKFQVGYYVHFPIKRKKCKT